MRVLLLVGVAVVVLVWGFSPAWGGVPNAKSIACPKGPAGWTSAAGAGGRSVRSPSLADAVPQSDWAPKTDQVTVICGYQSSSGKLVKVTVNYALPTADFNPFADFDVGCSASDAGLGLGNGAVNWNAKTRTYRVLSLGGWSYAGFADPTVQLAGKNVSGFETVARALLNRAAPAAHPCALPGSGGAAPLPKSWSLVFHVSVASGGQTTSGAFIGSFLTNPTGKDPVGPVSDFATNWDLILTIAPTDGSAPAAIDLRLDQPVLSFAPYATLTTTANVVSSTDAACAAGSTGTLVMSVAPSATLDLCGTNLLQGTPNGAAGIYVTLG